MSEFKQLCEFTGIEAENLDQFKEQFQSKFIVKENVIKDPELTDKIYGKIMGSQMTKIRQMFKEEGVEFSEDETKSVKKNDELFMLGLNKLKGSFVNQIEEVKKTSTTGTDDRLKDYEAKLQKLEKEKNDIKNAWKSTGEEFEKYKFDVANTIKNKEIEFKLSKAKEVLKMRPKINDAERAGFEAIMRNKLKFDLDDNGQLVTLNANGERIKSKVKAGDFMPAEEALQDIINELGLGDTNPHAGKPAPSTPPLFGMGRNAPMPQQTQMSQPNNGPRRPMPHPRTQQR